MAKNNLQCGTKTQKQYRLLHSTARELNKFKFWKLLKLEKFLQIRGGFMYYMIVMSSNNMDLY
jgi:hypothetical protein